MSADMRLALEAAVNTWNGKRDDSGIRLQIVPYGGAGDINIAPSTDPGKTLGVAAAFSDTGEIYYEAAFDGQYGVADMNPVGAAIVLTHEIGHMLNLKDNSGNIMQQCDPTVFTSNTALYPEYCAAEMEGRGQTVSTADASKIPECFSYLPPLPVEYGWPDTTEVSRSTEEVCWEEWVTITFYVCYGNNCYSDGSYSYLNRAWCVPIYQ
jgi:hypothetical protein